MQSFRSDAELVAVKELLSDCFASMRGNLADILPSGWELALSQSLAGLDPDLMAQQEKLFFVCVGSAVFSKDFATKAQAMKTVSLRKVRRGELKRYLIILNSICAI